MNKNNECDIIKDLLPSYAYNLTTEETNKFVEEHLQSCKDCQKVLDNIKSEENQAEEKKAKKYVNVAKKYNRKIKFLVLVIIVIILAIFSVTFLRNAVIMKSLSNKAKKYINCNNYHITWSMYNSESSLIYNIYYKDGKYVQKYLSYDFESFNEENGVRQVITYYDGNGKMAQYFCNEKVIDYQDIEQNSSMINPTLSPANMAQSMYFDESITNFIRIFSMNPITMEKCNGIDCYRYSFITSGPENISYVDKNTGLTVRTKSTTNRYEDGYIDNFSDVKFEFDTVTDEQVVMPSTEGYTVQ